MEGLDNSDNKSVNSESESEELDKLTEQEPENFNEEYYMYRKRVINPPTKRVKSHMFIKRQTNVQKCVAYCIDLMYNKQYPYVKLSAISHNMDKAVFIAEQLKRKVKNLHQINELETFHFTEVWTPKEEPTDERFKFKINKFSTNFEITLTRVIPKNKNHYGYQIPLQINLVSPRDPRDYIKYVLEQSRQPKKKELMSNSRRNYQNRNNRGNNRGNFNNNNNRGNFQNNNNRGNYQNNNNRGNYQNNNNRGNYQNNNNRGNYQNKNNRGNRNNNNRGNYQNNNNRGNYQNNNDRNFQDDNRDYISKPHHNFRKKKQNQYSDHNKPNKDSNQEHDNYYKNNQKGNNNLGYVKKDNVNNVSHNKAPQNNKNKKFRERKLTKEGDTKEYYNGPKGYEFGKGNKGEDNNTEENQDYKEDKNVVNKKHKKKKRRRKKNNNNYNAPQDEYVKKVDPRETDEYKLKEEH